MKICDIKITNPDKIICGDIKKIDLILYYQKIAPLMLPYISNRPLSVIRCHKGFNDACFFKKHPQLDNVKTFFDKDEEYFYLTTKKEIIYQAQMGTIEFHPWGSKVKAVDKPDIMIFDLDPDEKMPLETLRECVLKLKDILDQLNLTSFIKTSGGKGYHIVVPFSPCKNWDNFNNFSKQVALLMEQTWPKLFTSNIRKNTRKGKIFVDYLRNTKGATCVAPYSVRARENAPISVPISWKDLNKISPNEITIKNVDKYIKSNPWQDFFKVKQKLR